MDSLDDIRRKIETSINLYNTKSIEDFEGLSPADMRYILYDPFSKDSPLQFKTNIQNSILDQVPLLNQIEYLLQKINDLGEIKLTSTGALPTTIVKDIYNKGYIKDYAIENGITKLFAETSSQPIHLTKIIVELSGFTKKKNGKLSLTKAWKDKLLSKNRQDILYQIFSVFSQKFNWSYFDGYPSEKTGQLGFSFSLYLLSKYGAVERQDRFYSDKYLKAFPKLQADFNTSFFKGEENRQFCDCYSIRTFDRFLEYFNLTVSRTEGKLYRDSRKFIKKTAIFDEIISFDKS
jgi:hypothetical protein